MKRKAIILTAVAALLVAPAAALDINSSKSLQYFNDNNLRFEVLTSGQINAQDNLTLGGNSIENLNALYSDSSGTNFFGSCTGGQVVESIDSDGTVNCIDPAEDLQTEGLNETLLAGDIANQSIRMDGNNLVNPGLVDGVNIESPGAAISISGNQYRVTADSINNSLLDNSDHLEIYDLNVTKNLDLENGDIENFFDTACNSDEMVRRVYPNGSYVCTPVSAASTTEDLQQTLDEGNWTGGIDINMTDSELLDYFSNGVCSSGEVLEGVYPNGTYQCTDPAEDIQTESLNETLLAGDIANQSIRMDGNSILMGSYRLTDGGQGIQIGDSSTSTGDSDALAIGGSASASGTDAVAIGPSGTASDGDAVAIGSSSEAAGPDSVAIGRFSEAFQDNTMAIGDSSTASNDDAVAIGPSSSALGRDSAALGSSSEASSPDSVAIGTFSQASNDNAVTIGRYAGQSSTEGKNAVLIGADPGGSDSPGGVATGDDSIGLGTNVSATANGAVAIGNNSIAPNSYEATFGNLQGQELDVNVTGNLTVHGEDLDLQNGDIENYFANTCSGANEVVKRVYANGSYVCDTIPEDEGTESLNATLEAGNLANQTINMDDNNIENIGDLTGNNIVNNAQINSGAVDTAEIASGAVDSDELADGAATNAKIANTAINRTQIQDGEVTSSEINTGVAGNGLTGGGGSSLAVETADSTLTVGGTGVDVSSGGIDSNELAAGAVTNVKVADAAVNRTQLAQSGCTGNDVLLWDGSNWVCTAESNLGTDAQDLSSTNASTPSGASSVVHGIQITGGDDTAIKDYYVPDTTRVGSLNETLAVGNLANQSINMDGNDIDSVGTLNSGGDTVSTGGDIDAGGQVQTETVASSGRMCLGDRC